MDSVSKVKVEYTDASNVHAPFVDQLNRRLPLKDLHWSSTSRPTRSIECLSIDLVSSDETKSNLAPSSVEGASSVPDKRTLSKGEGSKSERRHQIPGLQRTPYLKVYLLSCSNVETYKAKYRKELGEWVRDKSPSSSSSTALNRQEHHDASEWLIIHVVPPLAEDPSSSSRPPSNQGDGKIEKMASSTRWPSRNGTSVIEKLRLDYNATSKGAPERVVQVQLGEPSSDDQPQIDQRVQDSKNGWEDLIIKLKSLILASFDLRVGQYEEDIKEREGQKKVFGWNFNTFFVLKEGLAMGFESIGLLDDALTVYQELDFGLKSALKEQQNEGMERQTVHYVDYTDDLYNSFEKAVAISEPVDFNELANREKLVDLGASLLDIDRKPFRDLILSNKISTFDFHCYVFARQTRLSLRRAKVDYERAIRGSQAQMHDGVSDHDDNSSRETDPPTIHKPEDLLLLAEIARLSVDFVTSMAFMVQEDVQNAIAHSKTSQDEMEEAEERKMDGCVEYFVMSWLFSACSLLLEVTLARSTAAQLETGLRHIKAQSTKFSHDHHRSQDIRHTFTLHRMDLPARSDSLSTSASPKPFSPAHEHNVSTSFFDTTRRLPPNSPRPGAQDLAARRGDLEALRKRIVSKIGSRHGWWQMGDVGAISVYDGHDGILQNLELYGNIHHGKHATASHPRQGMTTSTAGLCNASLLSCAISTEGFHELYEHLTLSALAHYVIGGRSKAEKAMITDFAMARFQSKDYCAAGACFRQLAPFYATINWIEVEISILGMYAQCLKHLEDGIEYVRICLKVLKKMIKGWITVQGLLPSPLLNVHRNYLSAILETSKSFTEELLVPLGDYFENLKLGKCIEHFTDQDGFTLRLDFRSLLPEALVAESASVRIVSRESDQRSELWLSTQTTQTINSGIAQLTFHSQTVQLGWFILDKLHIKSSNIVFSLDLYPATQTPFSPRTTESNSPVELDGLSKRKSLLVWARPGSFKVLVRHSETIVLDQPSSIKVELDAGQNDILRCRLLLKPASAGLRLHIAEAHSLHADTKIIGQPEPGSILIGVLQANTKACIEVPYSIETDLQDISLRVVAEYALPYGEFVFACSSRIPIQLPLAIGVQDLFRQNLLLSRFTIGTSTAVPVRILDCHLESNIDYHVISPTWINEKIDVFVRQPMSLLSKILRNSNNNNDGKPAQKKLSLKVKYLCWNQIILAAVANHFAAALNVTPFQKFSHVLDHALRLTLLSRMASQDCEAICLLRVVDVGTFDEWNWGAWLDGLPSDERHGLEGWLRRWHEENPKISLVDEDLTLLAQNLIVPVEVAQMQVVHTATLSRVRRPRCPPQLDAVPFGKGIPMELAITHTRRWGESRAFEMPNQALEFDFELQTNPDLWVVGGQKRAHFGARENETIRFAILLWPQKTGHLLLPSLEIHLLAVPQMPGEEERRPTEGPISCELDYQSLGETILVVPDLVSTTVSLNSSNMSSSGGSRLVESASRSA